MTRFTALLVLIALASLTATPVFAAEFTYQRLITIANELVKIALRIVGVIGVIMVVWFGLRMVMSRGDATKYGEARKGLLWSLVGLLVIFGVWTIIATIQGAVRSVGN
jgi:hypothetical protein